MSRPKKGEPGYAEFRERENARQREGRSGWASRGRGRTSAWREAHREEANVFDASGSPSGLVAGELKPADAALIVDAVNERDEARRLDAVRESDEAFARCARCDRPERAPCNAAAMRGLLEKIRHEYGWGRIGCRTCVSSEADVERVSDLFEKQIDAALAAPARNCDRYTTAKDALDAFIREKEIKSADVDNMNLRDFFDWLFAPEEGGDHA